MERVRSNSRTTRFGTKFIGSTSTLDSNLEASYNKKLLGIGAKASFIGGSGQSVGSGLAVYSIYHRQESTLTGAIICPSSFLNFLPRISATDVTNELLFIDPLALPHYV